MYKETEEQGQRVESDAESDSTLNYSTIATDLTITDNPQPSPQVNDSSTPM